MDPERQPLLSPVYPNIRNRGFRPLTYEEVQIARKETAWRRTKLALIILFWAIIAMFVSVIVCIIITTPKCGETTMGPIPSVPPVHLTLAPLFSSRKRFDEDNLYSL